MLHEMQAILLSRIELVRSPAFRSHNRFLDFSHGLQPKSCVRQKKTVFNAPNFRLPPLTSASNGGANQHLAEQIDKSAAYWAPSGTTYKELRCLPAKWYSLVTSAGKLGPPPSGRLGSILPWTKAGFVVFESWSRRSWNSDMPSGGANVEKNVFLKYAR